MNPKKLGVLLTACYSILILYWMGRLWGHFPAFMDTLEYVFPEKWLNVESFRQGRVPLWNPYLAGGIPHLANFQSAFFYPFFWVWNWTGLTNWFFVVALFHSLLALGGFYLWLRSQKASLLLSVMGGMSFAGSALLVQYWGFPTHLASIAWVPWIFWASFRFFEKPSWSKGVWVALAWAFQILAGYPFFTFYAFGFLWVCARWRWGADLRKGLLYLAAFTAALWLTACQWLPFLDFLGFLHREGRGGFLFNLNWKDYWTLFSPTALGVPGTVGYRGDYAEFIFDNFYLGLVPLGLFLWTFWPSAQTRTFFWKGCSLFWLLWPAGIHFIPWRLVPERWLDILEPSKASFLFLFCVFTSLAVNLQEKADQISKKNFFWRGGWLLGALWLLDLLFVPARIIQTVPNPYQNPRMGNLVEKVKDWTGGGRMLSLRPEARVETGGAGDSMEAAVEDFTPNTNMVWGIKSAGGYLSIYIDGRQNFIHYLQKFFPYDGRVFDAAGVRLLLCPQPLPAFKYRVSGNDGRNFFIQNAGALGEAWVVDRAREFPDRAAVFAGLLDPKAFLENEVYTEGSPDGKSVSLGPVQRNLPGWKGQGLWDKLVDWVGNLGRGSNAIEGAQIGPGQAGFQLQTVNQGAFLVFDESFAPGWHAWVDGAPKPIFRAYGLWMSLPLGGSGPHQVFFKYEPASFRLGLFLTLLSLALAAWALCRRALIPGGTRD